MSQERDGLHLENVAKRFGSLEAVKSVSLDIARGEFFSLLGPSGCGKTTLLRIIGGFEHPDSGKVTIRGREVTMLPPQKRPTAMVFQNYALFPNMTIGENVAYGLRVRKTAVGERTDRVSAALRRVELEGMEEKPVVELSGGQQQRVAVARALAVEPEVLLFDEPLSNLDVALREQTRTELKRLHQELGSTSVYVTHDQSEALVLSDRIGVMRAGSLIEVGPPRKLFEEPETAFVASFLGGWNVIMDAQTAVALTGTQPPDGHGVAIRPDRLHLGRAESNLKASVTARSYLGRHQEIILDAAGVELKAFVAPDLEIESSVGITAESHRLVRISS